MVDDVILRRIYDDPASTPEELARARQALGQANAALYAEFRNLPSDAKALLYGKYVGRLADWLKSNLPPGLPIDPLIDWAEDRLGKVIDRIIPERTRPSYQQQLESLIQTLRDRRPEAGPVIDIFGAQLVEWVSPESAEFERLILELQGHEDAGSVRARALRGEVSDRVMEQAIFHSIQEERKREEARRQQEEAEQQRQYGTTTFATGYYSGSGYRSGNGPSGSNSGGGSISFGQPFDGVSTGRSGGGGGSQSGGSFAGSISFGGSFDGVSFGGEGEPAEGESRLAQAFQQLGMEHLLKPVARAEVAPAPEPADPSPPERKPAHWFLPNDLGLGTSVTFVSPAIQQIKPNETLAVFEYRCAAERPLAFVFAADTSATLAPYSGAISTCTQTTFDCEVRNIYSENGLLVYEFQKRGPEGGEVLYGAQWLASLHRGEARLVNPVIPPHRKHPAGTRLLAFQMLTPNRRLIQQVYRHFTAAISAEHNVKATDEVLPDTWIRDAQLDRDRLVVRVARRGTATTVDVLVKYWPRTYSVAEAPRSAAGYRSKRVTTCCHSGSRGFLGRVRWRSTTASPGRWRFSSARSCPSTRHRFRRRSAALTCGTGCCRSSASGAGSG